MTAAKPLPRIHPSDEARFREYVDQTGGPDACWPFTGGLVFGYGSFRLGKRKVRAHRVAWVLWSGQPEPDPELHLDHACHDPAVCRNVTCPHRACCNPAHLRPVTPAQNVANSFGLPAQRREATHCVNMHELTEDNVRVWNGIRICRRCQADVTARRKPLRRRTDYDTHCVNGHAWTPENTHVNRKGSRICRTCARERNRATRAARRTAAAST